MYMSPRLLHVTVCGEQPLIGYYRDTDQRIGLGLHVAFGDTFHLPVFVRHGPARACVGSLLLAAGCQLRLEGVAMIGSVEKPSSGPACPSLNCHHDFGAQQVRALGLTCPLREPAHG